MFLKNKNLDFLKLVATEQGYRLYLYEPTITRPLLIQFEPMRLARRVRYLLEYLHKDHYKVFYLTDTSEVVGFCVIAKGGRRLPFSTKQDIVLGPYYVDREKRGRGYSTILIRMCLDNFGASYRKAFDWINKKNIPSIRASEACGFYRVGELNIKGLGRKLVPTRPAEGAFWVFQYDGLEDKTDESTYYSASSG